MRLWIIFLFLLLHHLGFGQTTSWLNQGDSLYKAKDFSNAALAYSRASRQASPDQRGQLFRTYSLAAQCWALSRHTDSAFAYLNLIAAMEDLPFVNLTSLLSEPSLASVRQDPRWERLADKLFERATAPSLHPINTTYTQTEVIYGRKDGLALTMLYLQPKTSLKGKAIILVRSGGWGSSFYMPRAEEALPFLAKGYAVFLVFHGSEPVYGVVDAVEDVQRAVRFIRFTAPAYAIDPDRLGIMGISAGGHLALMCGLADSSFVAASADPVDRMSSKVRFVAALSPTSDFLDWDGRGNTAFSAFLFKQALTHVLRFRQWNVQRRQFTDVTDSVEIRNRLRLVSPTYHVSPDDAGVLVLHGDKDPLMPIRQTEILAAKLKEAGVPVSFVKKKGEGHGWERTEEEWQLILAWFEKTLQ